MSHWYWTDSERNSVLLPATSGLPAGDRPEKGFARGPAKVGLLPSSAVKPEGSRCAVGLPIIFVLFCMAFTWIAFLRKCEASLSATPCPPLQFCSVSHSRSKNSHPYPRTICQCSSLHYCHSTSVFLCAHWACAQGEKLIRNIGNPECLAHCETANGSILGHFLRNFCRTTRVTRKGTHENPFLTASSPKVLEWSGRQQCTLQSVVGVMPTRGHSLKRSKMGPRLFFAQYSPPPPPFAVCSEGRCLVPHVCFGACPLCQWGV